MKKKLKAINLMAIEQAQKQDSTLVRQQKYNQVERTKPWSSTLQSLFFQYPPEQIVIHDQRIKFEGEIGLDWGGLKNEWLTLLSNEVFHPNYGLFVLTPNKQSIQPSPLAYIIPDYLVHYRMLGRLIGKALIENWNLEVTFSKIFLKHILGKELNINDLEEQDSELAKQLKWTLDNDIGDDPDTLCQNFEYSLVNNGKQQNFELIQNGRDIMVVEDNKKEYVKCLCQFKMITCIKKQTIAFKQGLNDIIPLHALNFLQENELQLHLSGLPTFDDSVLFQLKKYCKYEGYKQNDQTIQDFWKCIKEYNSTMRANLLFYFTGSFKIPFEGFKDNPLRISKCGALQALPVAHTCFFQIELPDYKNFEVLKKKLTISVMQGGSGGFQII